MALFDACTSAFKLDDTSDSTGTVTALTNNNSVTFVSGKVGNCAQFVAASSQSLSHGSVPALEMGDIDWVLGAWVWLDTKSVDMVIVAKQDNSGTEYRLQYNQAVDCFQFNFSANGGVVAVNVGDAAAVNTGEWYCVLAWHDAALDTIYIQKNYETVYNNTTGGAGDAPLTAVPFRIGARASTFPFYWDGKIDAVHIWKGRILSAGERTAFYNSGLGVEFTAGGGQMPYFGGAYSPYRQVNEIVGY